MSFTLNSNGTDPVAKITGSKGKITLVYIDPQKGEGDIPSILDDELDPEIADMVAKALKSGMSLRDIETYLSAIKAGETSEKKSKKKIIRLGRELTINPGEKINVIPNHKNQRIYVGGPSGCGKSTFIKEYVKVWKNMNPEKEVYIFCRSPDDPAFLTFEHNEIVISDELLETELDVSIFQDSLVIYDDCDNIQNKKILDYIHKLMNDCMANGRKLNVTCIYVTHILLGGHRTKLALNDSDSIVFFPGLGNAPIINLLKTHCGRSPKEAKDIIDLESRWCYFSRTRPQYIIHEKGIFLL